MQSDDSPLLYAASLEVETGIFRRDATGPYFVNAKTGQVAARPCPWCNQPGNNYCPMCGGKNRVN